LFIEVKSSEANSNNKMEEIDHFIQSKMEKNHIPGVSVVITHNKDIIFTKGYGRTADNSPVTADTLFPIASISKAFTALAVMQLAEEGRINLDHPVVQYIPSLKLNDPRASKITPRNLLNHTSGLTDKVYPDMTLDPQPRSLEEVVRRLRNVSLSSEPGTEYHYNNTNYQLLALIVEKVSREEFSKYLEHHIFAPLDMKQTFNVSNTKELNKSNKLAGGHYFLFGQPMAKDEPDWFIEGPAGIVSSANDMANWLILQSTEGKYQNNKLLSSKGIQEMQTPASSKFSYGMGWNIFKDDHGIKQIQHSGILWTYKSESLLLPEKGYGIVILFNSGLNSFVDYYALTDGIAKILTNQDVSEPFYNNQLFDMLIGIIIIVTFLLGVRQLLRLNSWVEKYKNLPKWRSVLNFLLRLIPLCLLIFLPKIMTFIGGGRVLSWEGIFLMMPSIFIWLLIASLLNLTIIIFLAKRLFCLEK
jgi:CubicO group peptidase (beta-lactamase class C family)